MTIKLSDQWQTPKWLFDEIEREHGPFDIDLCATENNSKCDIYGHNYLKNDFCYTSNKHIYVMGGLIEAIREFYDYEYEAVCFMNPPYSNPRPFIEKAWEDSKYCKIVCLVKADPSTKWWAVFWEYNIIKTRDIGCKLDTYHYPYDFETEDYVYNGPKPGCEVRFFPKRIQFDPPQQLIDSGEVWKVKNKWAQRCIICLGHGHFFVTPYDEDKDVIIGGSYSQKCKSCKGKGYIVLSGPTFPSALIIMDRRNV